MPGLSLTELTAQLRGGQRLDAFELTGENLRTVFSWSYQALSPAAARLFRLLAVHPGQTLSTAGVAALAAADQVGEALAELTRANLLDQHSTGRYRCHGLHEHAWQLALALSSFCYVGKQRRDWLNTSEIGLGSARILGDPKAEGAMLASLGSAHAV